MENKILLIEDDSDIRENMSELLELEGYKIITASNGKEGLSMATSKSPDLIICDVKMPELTGIQVLEKLRALEKTSNIPVIFCTASAQRSEIELGQQAGAVAYIVKPYEEETLFKAISQFLY